MSLGGICTRFCSNVADCQSSKFNSDDNGPGSRMLAESIISHQTAMLGKLGQILKVRDIKPCLIHQDYLGNRSAG